jgi:hypothetical protein
MDITKFTPSTFGKVRTVVWEQLYGLYLVIVNAFPVLLDIVRANWRSRGKGYSPKLDQKYIPTLITELTDADTYSVLVGRSVKKVEFAERLEQHANSTDRAWLIVTYADGTTEQVFAKVRASNVIVRFIMSMFDVYRNEMDTYMNIKMPTGVLTPRVHSAKWSPSRFVLIMEDLRLKDVEFPNIWIDPPCSYKLAQKVLNTLACMHAEFWENVPKGAWNDHSRPYFGKTICMFTLYRVEQSLPGLIPKDIHDAFMTALWHWHIVREFWSESHPKTMIHGDSHLGNFFIQKDGAVGTFDFQCKAEEHCMRDVTYFLCNSYPEFFLEKDEKPLIAYYLERLSFHLKDKRSNDFAKLTIPTFDECWTQYRMQCFYALYAFVFSGGLANLMDDHQTAVGVKRIVAQMQRVKAPDALYELLSKKI